MLYLNLSNNLSLINSNLYQNKIYISRKTIQALHMRHRHRHNRQGQNKWRKYERKIKIKPKMLLTYTLIFILLLFLFFKFRPLIIFIVVAILAGYLNYLIHITHIHIHSGHVPFLAIIFSYALGIKFGLLMILIGHIIPEVLAGHVDSEMIVSALAYALVSYITTLFPSANIVFLGIVLTILLTIISGVIEFFLATPLFELISEHGSELVFMMIYFISFAKPLLVLIG